MLMILKCEGMEKIFDRCELFRHFGGFGAVLKNGEGWDEVVFDEDGNCGGDDEVWGELDLLIIYGWVGVEDVREGGMF